jgi:riboflavin-specific deaminase-like protein
MDRPAASAFPEVRQIGNISNPALDIISNATASAPFVLAQLGQSLDGRIATSTGDSRYINTSSALDHLHAIRARVDVVVVGIGTVLADDPQLNVRRLPGRNPARVIIDPNCRLPASAKCLHDDGTRRIVVGPDRPKPHGVEIVDVPRAPGGHIPPKAMVETLHKMGFSRMLIEGGASTISAFIDADCVDRLHLLVGRVIIGSGKTGLDLAPVALLAEARRPRTTTYILHDGDVLFDCDLRT